MRIVSSLLILGTYLCLTALPVSADSADPDARTVVVTANRTPTALENVASSITVITEEEIQRSEKTQVVDILRGVPGVDVVRSGGPGGNVAVFLRGANSEHTLVLIDGIEVNNPISNARFFNFADLTLDNVERIEILRGPQSTLYGSDAIGGVISIFTKRGSEEVEASASVEAGSYETFIEKATVRGTADILDLSLAASRQDIDGVSAASKNDGNFEDDGYENTSLSLRAGLDLAENAEFNSYLRYTDAKSDLDNTGGVGGDDPNRLLDNEQLFTRGELVLEFFEGMLEQRYGVGYTDHELVDNNDPDEAHPEDILRSNFDGDLFKLDLQNTVAIGEGLQLIAGVETEKERGSSNLFSDGEFGPFEDNLPEQDARTNGYYAQFAMEDFEGFSSTAGIRVDSHSEFDEEVTFRIAPAYWVDASNTKLTGTVGTGFKAPSLYQLYSSFGNQDLNPEESLGWELGLEQHVIEDQLVLGVTYFQNEIEELITFEDATFQFFNIDEADIEGLEVFVRYAPTDTLTFRSDYTYTDTEDKETGSSLLRRARNKASASMNYAALSDRLNIFAEVVYTGARFDNDFSSFPAERVRLASYTLVNLAISYTLFEHLDLFARVDNLFDKDYEEVFGFGTLGAAGYGGIRVKL